MKRKVIIADKKIGPENPTFIVGEIGINHNGSLKNAKKLIDAAHDAGCDAVKFQKRTPELCVPKEQRNVMRETPWGYITYLDYRYKVEFGEKEYSEIDRYCKEKGMLWFASCWDIPSVDFIEKFDPACYKIQSAGITDLWLLQRLKATGKPLIMSTGMSTMEQIHTAVGLLGEKNLVLCHSTSTYPCPPEELNLKMIPTLMGKFHCPIGYSGHEVGLVPSASAVVLGADLVERHITLDRSMWGSDQSASIEPGGLRKLVKYIRTMEKAVGDGIKRVYESEKPGMKKLRKVKDVTNALDLLKTYSKNQYAENNKLEEVSL